jgi:hypothetical protein
VLDWDSDVFEVEYYMCEHCIGMHFLGALQCSAVNSAIKNNLLMRRYDGNGSLLRTAIYRRQHIVAMYPFTTGFCGFWLQPSVLLGQFA